MDKYAEWALGMSRLTCEPLLASTLTNYIL